MHLRPRWLTALLHVNPCRLNAGCTPTHTQKKYVKYDTLLAIDEKAYYQRVYFAGSCTELCLKTKDCKFWQTNKVKGCQLYANIKDTTVEDAPYINMGTCTQ